MKYATEYLNKIYCAIDTLYLIDEETEEFYYIQTYQELLNHNPEYGYRNAMLEMFQGIIKDLEENKIPLLTFLNPDDIDTGNFNRYQNIKHYINDILGYAEEAFNNILECFIQGRHLNGVELEIIENAIIKEYQIFNKNIYCDDVNYITISSHETFLSTLHQPNYIYLLNVIKRYPLFNDIYLITQEEAYNLIEMNINAKKAKEDIKLTEMLYSIDPMLIGINE